ncbi:MAG: alpha/beta fold hydrolase [Candidatus Binataceae bacterium]
MPERCDFASATPNMAPHEAARILARAVMHIGLEHYALMAGSADVPIALWHALESPGAVNALMLISPSALAMQDANSNGSRDVSELRGRLVEIAIPVLLCRGTIDTQMPASGDLGINLANFCRPAEVYGDLLDLCTLAEAPIPMTMPLSGCR